MRGVIIQGAPQFANKANVLGFLPAGCRWSARSGAEDEIPTVTFGKVGRRGDFWKPDRPKKIAGWVLPVLIARVVVRNKGRATHGKSSLLVVIRVFCVFIGRDQFCGRVLSLGKKGTGATHNIESFFHLQRLGPAFD